MTFAFTRRTDPAIPRRTSGAQLRLQASGPGQHGTKIQKKRPRTTGRIRRSDSHRSLCTDRWDVDYCELRNGKRLCHGIDGITLQTDHLGLDASSSDPEHDFLSGDFHTTIGGITYLLDDGNIKLEIDSLGVDTKTGGLSLRGIRLLPQLPKSDFARSPATTPTGHRQ